MESYFQYLDVVWKGLVFIAAFSTLTILLFFLTEAWGSGLATSFRHRLSQTTLLATVSGVVLSFCSLTLWDPEWREGCFQVFIRDSNALGITRWASGLWTIGFVYLIVRDFIKYRKFLNTIKKSVRKRRHGYEVVSDDLPAMAVGILSPRIYIPEYLLNSKTRLFHVLAHEAVHIRCRHGLWGLGALIVLRLCWFHPLVLLFERRRRLLVEMATDEQVIRRRGFNCGDYATTLFQLAARPIPLSSPLMTAAGSEHFEELRARILAMQSKPRASRNKRWAVAVLFFTGLSFGQAWAVLRPVTPKEMPGMCSQVEQEKWISQWLSIETSTPRCEKETP